MPKKYEQFINWSFDQLDDPVRLALIWSKLHFHHVDWKDISKCIQILSDHIDSLRNRDKELHHPDDHIEHDDIDVLIYNYSATRNPFKKANAKLYDLLYLAALKAFIDEKPYTVIKAYSLCRKLEDHHFL